MIIMVIAVMNFLRTKPPWDEQYTTIHNSTQQYTTAHNSIPLQGYLVLSVPVLVNIIPTFRQ